MQAGVSGRLLGDHPFIFLVFYITKDNVVSNPPRGTVVILAEGPSLLS